MLKVIIGITLLTAGTIMFGNLDNGKQTFGALTALAGLALLIGQV